MYLKNKADNTIKPLFEKDIGKLNGRIKIRFRKSYKVNEYHPDTFVKRGLFPLFFYGGEILIRIDKECYYL